MSRKSIEFFVQILVLSISNRADCFEEYNASRSN